MIAMASKINSVVESTTFLVCELVFCLAFISICEIPNWTRGPYSANQCVDRWMFMAGLFTPSGIQAVNTKPRQRSTSSPVSHTGPDTTK